MALKAIKKNGSICVDAEGNLIVVNASDPGPGPGPIPTTAGGLTFKYFYVSQYAQLQSSWRPGYSLYEWSAFDTFSEAAAYMASTLGLPGGAEAELLSSYINQGYVAFISGSSYQAYICSSPSINYSGTDIWVNPHYQNLYEVAGYIESSGAGSTAWGALGITGVESFQIYTVGDTGLTFYLGDMTNASEETLEFNFANLSYEHGFGLNFYYTPYSLARPLNIYFPKLYEMDTEFCQIDCMLDGAIMTEVPPINVYLASDSYVSMREEGSCAFNGSYPMLSVYVPSSYLTQYQQDPNWAPISQYFVGI